MSLSLGYHVYNLQSESCIIILCHAFFYQEGSVVQLLDCNQLLGTKLHKPIGEQQNRSSKYFFVGPRHLDTEYFNDSDLESVI